MWNYLSEIAVNFFYNNRHYNLSFNKSNHRSAFLWLLTVLTLYRYFLVSSLVNYWLHDNKKLFIGVKTYIVSAHKSNDMAELSVSAFLFVSCPYVLNAQRLGERFFKLEVVSYDSLYLNVIPLETLFC